VVVKEKSRCLVAECGCEQREELVAECGCVFVSAGEDGTGH